MTRARQAEELDGLERREAARLDKVFRVYLEGERGCGLGIARNISRGGLFVETRAPQPIGTQVRITFPSESGDMLAVAEVRYVCHLLASGARGETHPQPAQPRPPPLTLRGMGLRFLYFELGQGTAAVVH